MNKEEMIKKVTKDKLKNISVTKPFLKNKLDLPKYLKFGFEIEALIDDDLLENDMLRATNQDFFNNEEFKGIFEFIESDNDIVDYAAGEHYVGGEIVTPILIDSEESWQDIKKVCEYLKLKAKCTESCSVHTNIGAQALGGNYKNWYNFLKIIAVCEPEIYRYLANGEKIRSGAITGGYRKKFAMPVAQLIRNGLEKSNKNNVNSINELINNCSFNGEYEYMKDKSISLKGIFKAIDVIVSNNELDEEKYGRRIEFRMANGTFSAEEIQNHIYIIGKIIELSKNLSSEKDKMLDELLKKELPSNYNEDLKIDRILDVANILFDKKEDKMQFLFTLIKRLKNKEIITEKEEILKLIKKENMVLEFASDELKADVEVVLEAVKHGGAQIQYANEELRNNMEIGLIAVKKYGKALQYLSEGLKSNKEIVLEAVRNNAFALRYASEQLQSDKQVILEAAKKNKKVLKYVDENIVFDKDFFYELYKDNIEIEYYLKFGQIKDKKEFTQQLENDEIVYKYFLKQELKRNSEIEKVILDVLYRLKNNMELSKGSWNKKIGKEKYNKFVMEIFNMATKEKNYKLLFKIIDLDKTLFEVLSEEEQNNKEIALMVIKEKPNYFEKLSEKLRSDKDVVLEAVKKNGTSLVYASNELKNDKVIVLEAIKQNGSVLEFASEELKNDKAIVLEAIKQNGSALEFASEELKNDKVIVLEAIKQNGSALEFASEELKNDKEVALEVVSKNGYLLYYVSKELRNDKEVVMEAIKNKGNALEDASEELRNDREIVLQAVKQNGISLKYASEELKNDKVIVLEAIKQNGSVLEFASEEYKKCFECEVEL